MRSVRSLSAILAAVFVLMMIGCETDVRNQQDGPTEGAETTRTGSATTSEDVPVVLFVGTSLTAGYGLSSDEAFPALIQQKIDSVGLEYEVVNAGVSGETSAGARSRIDWLMRQPFAVLVLETGANDMLRGADVDSARANIEAIIQKVGEQRPDAVLVLAGMMAPPNLGRDYSDQFNRIYREIAGEYDLPLVPFILDDVGGEAELNLADGIHPNAEGHQIVAENIWQVLEPVLQTAQREIPYEN